MAKQTKRRQVSQSSRHNPQSQVVALPTIPPRLQDAHKGDFGRVLVIAGSREMIGAPALVALAALRSGAGLVTIACPRSVQLAVAALCPCATSLPLPEDSNGRIRPREAVTILEKRGWFDARSGPSVVAAGPGIGQLGASVGDFVELVRRFTLQPHSIPVILDADGLNAVSSAHTPVGGNLNWMIGSNVVLTPHPGEMARMLGISAKAVQSERERIACQAASDISNANRTTAVRSGIETAPESAPVVLLKGAGTIVTDGRRVFRCSTGNPGMATGGSGDVLTGVIAGLVAQGLSRFDAAVLAAHLHGRAGDRAAAELGQISLIATDLIEYLPSAFRELSRGRTKKKGRRLPIRRP